MVVQTVAWCGPQRLAFLMCDAKSVQALEAIGIEVEFLQTLRLRKKHVIEI